ncbi:MAG: osmotically inducible protein OsmC [Crocinitomicaceae bacterium]|nr:osmotically inducible protein OsmC [Crocinitomicaceae bacterium]|tara:strand:- start:990 stop:1388 length:399 start_codon:yes stop_codon:yes gene_type:complete
MSPDTIVKCSLNDEKYLTSINGENHQFYVDEPLEYGGDDSAPKPTEYLLGALGACTAITMKMYAKRKQWNLGKINLSIQLINNNAENKIIKHVSFEEKLSDNKIEKLLKIGEKCPVSKMLAFPVKMELITKV